MQSNSSWRLWIVAGVTAISLWLIWPTLHYFLAVSGKLASTPEQQEDLRRRSVPLGLDLQGGVDVTLAVDEAKTRQNKVDAVAETIRERFKRESPPIDATVQTTGTSQILLTVNKAEQARTVANLIKGDLRGNFTDFNESDLQAGKSVALSIDPQMLQSDLDSTVESSLKVLRDRVDKMGVTQPVVVRSGSKIRVQIPGEKDPEHTVKTIIRPARLEFRGVHIGANPNNEGKYRDDSEEYIDRKTGKPLEGKSIPPGYVVRQNKEVQDETLGKGAKTYTLVKQKIEMTGKELKDAGVQYNDASLGSAFQVHVEFNSEGAKRFEQVTTNYVKKPLAILLDDVVYSAPNVEGVISEGSCVITGQFSHDDARDLSLVLKAGALPAELQTRDQRIVEATLGADSIKSSITALFLGSLIIAVYMIFYYRTAGFIADIAVFINVLLIFAFMKMASATLTLSGIGGILLTVGMAVDANVLIYERIREELHHGKTLRQAISLGFGRAFSVIFDTNITTLISGLTLLQFGEGSVKGFALALNIGIAATLFTGLFCTRAIVEFWYSRKKTLSLGKFQWLPDNTYIDFVGLRKYSFVWSGVLFLLCAAYVTPWWHGSNWGVDFAGGVLSEIQTSKAPTVQELKGAYSDWTVQKVQSRTAGKESYIIRTKFADESADQIAKTKTEVVQRLDKELGTGNYQILGSDAVSSEVGKEFTSSAIAACLIASIGIMLYIWSRFEFAFGFAAVVALFHDLIITYGLFNVLSEHHLAGEVTLDIVSALLVILGYSVHDTIIILDRIRENLRLQGGADFKHTINQSICESLNRTFMTVSTVLIVLLVMLFIGGVGLRDFALVLLIGIIKGTYSSSFIACPILYEMYVAAKKKGRSILGRRTKIPAAPAERRPAVAAATAARERA